jgi:uncharacterized protein DUF5677
VLCKIGNELVFGLQEAFDKKVKEQFRPNILGTRILEAELEKIGIEITDEQRSDLENQLSNIESGSLHFDFSDEQVNKAKVDSENDLKLKLEAIINNLGTSVIEFSKKIDGVFEDLIPNIVDSMAKSINTTLVRQMADMLEDQEAISNEIFNEITEVWGKPLGLLQGLIVIADESVESYLTKSAKYANYNIVQEVLLRIHAKSNQISKEILCLLKNGFADGAQARWRSLHELAVISFFISNHGEDVATRYIEHESIEVYKAAIQYNQYYTRLGAVEISREEIELMAEDYNALIEKYGKYYRYDYGWAANVLKSKRPTFRDIEANIELDHLRPYYKAASSNIHASPTGVLSRLGLLPEEDVLLAGPSVIGLTEPAQSTIISLVQITTALLTFNADIDALVVCKTMSEYGKEVENAFIEVESKLVCE